MRTPHTLLMAVGCLLAVSAGAQTVERIEYFLDTDPGYGRGVAVASPAAGEQGYTLDLTEASQGLHVLHMRAQDDCGQWSVTWSRPVFVCRYPGLTDVGCLEYFFDTDPGYGHATRLPQAATGEHAYLVPTDGQDAGPHVLHLRAQDLEGRWSTVWSRPLYVQPVAQGTVERMEFFFDDAEPACGEATPVTLSQTVVGSGQITFDVDVASLALGEHQLHVRAADADGRWSLVASEPFTVTFADGITSVVWTLPLSVSLKQGVCTVASLADGQRGDCTVSLHALDGRLLARASWPAEAPSVVLEAPAAGRPPVILSVEDRTTGRRVVRKIME